MKFTALPVKVGDSFLLEIKEKKILVDGGMDQNDIIKLLDAKKIKNKHINLLICTHYDADHINGIIGILKSDYTFNEIWLPEIYGTLSKTVSKNLKELIDYYHQTDHEEAIERLNNDKHHEEITDYQQCDFNDDSFESIDINLLETIINDYHLYNIPSIFRRIYYPLFIDYQKMNDNLNKILTLTKSAISSGSYIRWFHYTGKHENVKINYDLIPQNAIQTKCSIYPPDLFYKILYLTTINKRSLVFKFDDEKSPNVLFTADSDLAFVENEIHLKKNSIVTAPHHGSSENDQAYSKISGEELIFVRSDRSQIKRPGKGYLGKNNKYCTICRNMGEKSEVIIEIEKGKIKTPVKKCICGSTT